MNMTTPLKVILIFVSLTETAMVTAATQMEGDLQKWLVIFSMIFALLVFVSFIFTLWFRPWVYYPPESFSNETTVVQYVEAMSTKQNISPEVLKIIKESKK